MLKNGLSRYLKTVSILKKGYEQERYRIQTLSNSFLGTMKVREILSHHIAQYRDERLQYDGGGGNIWPQIIGNAQAIYTLKSTKAGQKT